MRMIENRGGKRVFHTDEQILHKNLCKSPNFSCSKSHHLNCAVLNGVFPAYAVELNCKVISDALCVYAIGHSWESLLPMPLDSGLFPRLRSDFTARILTIILSSVIYFHLTLVSALRMLEEYRED
jgi:hypothetical protein